MAFIGHQGGHKARPYPSAPACKVSAQIARTKAGNGNLLSAQYPNFVAEF
jgi:hypothetical protein